MGSSSTSSRGRRASARVSAELRLLAAGQPAGLLLQRDAQLTQPGPGIVLVEPPVQVAGQVQHVGGGQVLVQRRVLGDERDAVQRGRHRRAAAEHGDGARGRRRQADCQVQQGGLAGAVRADQRRHVPGGNRQRALAQRPGAAVALAQAGGFDDVHATPSVPAPALSRRPAGAPRSRKSRSAVVNSATTPSSSSPATSAEVSQPSRERRSTVSSGSATRFSVARMNVPWPGPGRQALGLQFAVGLEHRVRVDGQRGDRVPDLGQLVAGLEVPELQRVLDLMHELQVGRHARGGVEPELIGDTGPRPAAARVLLSPPPTRPMRHLSSRPPR